MSMPLAVLEQLENLSMFEDRADRIEALLALAEQYRHPDVATVSRNSRSRIPGCESEVYFKASKSEEGNLEYRFAVDNPQGVSAMALAVILEKGSGVQAEQVSRIPETIVFDVFGGELSMGKNLGLTNMVKMLKQVAQSETQPDALSGKVNVEPKL